MPFETRDFSGTLIAAGTETEAADVTYPLDVQGWHAVSIGPHVPSGHEINWAISAGGHDHIPVQTRPYQVVASLPFNSRMLKY